MVPFAVYFLVTYGFRIPVSCLSTPHEIADADNLFDSIIDCFFLMGPKVLFQVGYVSCSL